MLQRHHGDGALHVVLQHLALNQYDERALARWEMVRQALEELSTMSGSGIQEAEEAVAANVSA